MGEGKQYKADYKASRSGVQMWLAKRPAVKGAGPDWQSALDSLTEAICNAYGDGEPNICFTGLPPADKDDFPWLDSSYADTDANGDCYIGTPVELLFTGGGCRLCGHGVGTRTDAPLEAVSPGVGDYCGVWMRAPAVSSLSQLAYLPVIVSEKLLHLLSDAERQPFEWRAVFGPEGSRRRYFECVPKRWCEPVAVKGWAQSGWRCDECGFKVVHSTPSGEFNSERRTRFDWYKRGDLPAQADRPFAIGGPAFFTIAFPMARALELAKRDDIEGFSISMLGVVPDEMVAARPSLTMFSECFPGLRADRPDPWKQDSEKIPLE